MKNILRFLFAALCLTLISACKGDPHATYTRSISITSKPEGAKLIVNGITMSKTPISIEVEATENDCFLIPTQFIALALDKDTHTQIVSYPAFKGDNELASKIPETIVFDMSKPAKEEPSK